ncbi:hypothetical protein GC173_00750 [bacterium]|nr:hypothetical protein [bacterium]
MRLYNLAVSTVLAVMVTAAGQAEEEVPPCFPGAIYRKAVSQPSNWIGIEGTLIVPTFEPDPARINPATGRPRDNASVYMGGNHEGVEIDAGLTWEVVRDRNGSVSRQPGAFRPFWRNKQWYNAPAKPEYYYFPGDTVKMRCSLVAEEEMELEVVLVRRASRSREAARALNVDYVDAPTTLTARFAAPTFNFDGPQDFKRVNAIDQSGNEGKAVQPTAAKHLNAAWFDVRLLSPEGSVPFDSTTFRDMRCPNRENVRTMLVSESDPTFELIELMGTPAAHGDMTLDP